MHLVTILYATMATMSVTLAGIYLGAWLMQREDRSHLLFVVLSLSIAGVAGTELWMLRAQTPEEYGVALRWYHVPIWSGICAFVGLVYLRLRPRFGWLGWVALGLRTAALVANFSSGQNLNYLALAGIDHINLLGEQVAIVAGAPNPWMLLGQVSNALLVVFILDGGVSAWRRGEGWRALSLVLSLLVPVGLGATQAVLVFWGLARLPMLVTPLLLFIAIVMGFELSFGFLRAARAERRAEIKEEALSVSEQQLALAAEAADVGFWSVDGQSGAVWATAKTRELFGLPLSGNLRLADFLARVHRRDRARLEGLMVDALDSNDRYRAEFRVVNGDGGIRWLSGLGRTMDQTKGGPKTLMGVSVDISERRAALDGARRQRAGLERVLRVESLNELSASLAHQLRQPLAMILSNAEAAQAILEAAPPNLAEVREILADIISADRRAAEVIRHLRALFHRGEPHCQDLLLDHAIHRVLHVLGNEIDEQGVGVDLDLAPDLPRVRADRVLIEQVLLNLINNACEAVAANPQGERRVSVTTRVHPDRVTVEVADNGCGMPDPKRVFDASYSTKAEGVGMGLAIVRSVINSHGGRVWAASPSVGGAIVAFSLPRDGAVP